MGEPHGPGGIQGWVEADTVPGTGRECRPVISKARWLLELVQGVAIPPVVILAEPITLGRDPGASMRLLDPAVSRMHASITPAHDDCACQVEDLGSSNGTFVNGHRVERVTLHNGDLVQLGNIAIAVVDTHQGTKRTVTHQRKAKPPAVPFLSAAQETSSAVELVGSSPAMQEIQGQIQLLGSTLDSVLILGETGTGKELVARALHRVSPQAGGPFVAINCSAIAPNLVESELFGHEKGAFTGADRQFKGKFEQAQGGTLFLDEVVETPLGVQPKLLRALEERTVERIAGLEPVAIDARFIAASNRNLAREAKAGRFRQDLFYRLAVLTIRIPPLRDRAQDIPELIDHFARPLGDLTFQDDVVWAMQEHTWPGNVRELRNVVRALSLLAEGGTVTLDVFEKALAPLTGESLDAIPAMRGGTLRDAERMSIQRALLASGWNKSAAAKTLGISRPTLNKKIKDFGLRRP